MLDLAKEWCLLPECPWCASNQKMLFDKESFLFVDLLTQTCRSKRSVSPPQDHDYICLSSVVEHVSVLWELSIQIWVGWNQAYGAAIAIPSASGAASTSAASTSAASTSSASTSAASTSAASSRSHAQPRLEMAPAEPPYGVRGAAAARRSSCWELLYIH